MAVGNGRYFVTIDDPAVAVSCMSAGIAYVGQVENQLALGGAERFVILNTAGGFGPDIAIGDLARLETAVRDDGICDHYLPPVAPSTPTWSVVAGFAAIPGSWLITSDLGVGVVLGRTSSVDSPARVRRRPYRRRSPSLVRSRSRNTIIRSTSTQSRLNT